MENTPPRPKSAGTSIQYQAGNPAAAPIPMSVPVHASVPVPAPVPVPVPAITQLQTRKRSGSGGGLLSRFPFMRTSDSKSNSSLKESRHIDIAEEALSRPTRALAPVENGQQPKTRRRKGSLRKVALLGRGMQRERRESKSLVVDTTGQAHSSRPADTARNAADKVELVTSPAPIEQIGLGVHLGTSDDTPRPSIDGYARRADVPARSPPPPASAPESQGTSPDISYISTTDEEDIIPSRQHNVAPLRAALTNLSSGSESYLKPARGPSLSIQRRRSVKHAKSPLSLQGLAASPLPAPDEEYDYSETEWWGWVILVVTWVVFVIGMGSCLGVWSWAWDVGTTPYAPPELEDDPTLPITGYYPSLMILTCIMAWVWVVTAWVGMKYFRHAKISGD
ncbi:hypothetical protein BKA67DRAFT_557751 [Truncatella angustata]|uniref:Uncharacterized protein n=1 Tax=Truncatella angustata TaxID=152316 RepID=A0A9P8UUK3_9PEZI|nr:uncharacterized protein BKA67DRAFT_557751 [Truncatella angustata]KAH6658342.1 hypothetical protein BKA67DRAFT_557751 [Truncatella angustata]KAH8200821.1 hypothetical protein TruAng_005058 [Truncatella angustata]